MNNFLAHEKLRCTIYNLLSRCYKMPEESLKQEKVVETLVALLALINNDAADYGRNMVKELSVDKNLEDLKLDYLRLFIGPKTLLAPPYGSLYLEDKRQVMGISTYDAIEIYKSAGLEKSDDFKEPPDHIRVELEFMHYLIAKVVESCEEDNLHNGRKYIQLQLEFLKRHIGSWVRPFTQNINQNAQTKFYKNLALATEAFIRQEYLKDSLLMKEEFEEIQGYSMSLDK